MGEESVRYELQDSVAVIRLDDGKANALSPGVIDALRESLERAEKDVATVLLVGRPGRFSAGFDLNVMRQGGDALRSLVTAGAELALRIFGFPRPVVAACTGHAIAMGAIVLLAADHRVGARGEFKLGLNEVALGMTLPLFGVELARHRISRRHLTRAVLASEMYAPDTAVDAGFLDRVVEPGAVYDEALSEAHRLSQLGTGAFRNTKHALRETTIAHIRETLEADMARLTAPPKR